MPKASSKPSSSWQTFGVRGPPGGDASVLRPSRRDFSNRIALLCALILSARSRRKPFGTLIVEGWILLVGPVTTGRPRGGVCGVPEPLVVGRVPNPRATGAHAGRGPRGERGGRQNDSQNPSPGGQAGGQRNQGPRVRRQGGRHGQGTLD
eukprot:819390-Prorocentrum_minimum.AAC.2